MKIIRLFTLPVLTVMLAACGGGGGGTESTSAAPTAPNTAAAPATQAAYIDKYSGVWKSVCLTNDGVNESGNFISTISKKSDSALTFALTATRFSGKTCTGTALPNIFPGATRDITYVATVSDIDRFTYAGNGKSSLKITGSMLYLGNELNLDVAGYPVVDFKELASAFIKN